MPSLLSECLLGGIAAASATVLTNPAEIVKIRFQLQGEQSVSKATSSSPRPQPYQNLQQSLAFIVRHDGFRGIQRGLVASMAYQFLMNGIRFGSYQAAGQCRAHSRKRRACCRTAICRCGGVVRLCVCMDWQSLIRGELTVLILASHFLLELFSYMVKKKKKWCCSSLLCARVSSATASLAARIDRVYHSNPKPKLANFRTVLSTTRG